MDYDIMIFGYLVTDDWDAQSTSFTTGLWELSDSWVAQEKCTVRLKTYEELSDKENLQADCDLKATKIVLQGLSPDVYALVNHHKIAKDIWDRVKLLILPPEWGKFMTDVKLARDLHTSNYDQLYAYLEQYESNPYGAPHHPQQYPTTYPTNLSYTQPFVTQNAYPPLTIAHQPQAEFPQLDSGLAVPTFLPYDDLIACMNKAIAFLSAVFSPCYPSTNKQLESSSNPRNQATIQDGRVTVQQVQGRQGQNVVGSGSQRNASGEGHMARQCTQPKRRRDVEWFKEKVLLFQAQAEGKELDEEQLAFLADPGVANDQVRGYYGLFLKNRKLLRYSEHLPIIEYPDNEIISNNNIIPYSQYLEEMQHDKANNENKIVNESLTVELERYKERVKILEQRFNVDLSSHEKFIDSQMDDMIRMKNTKFAAFKMEIDTLKQTLSKHVKENES
ncbi:hypothetical protein Tco_0436750 [Tanacetum coccineum]